MLAKRIIPCLDVDNGRVKKGVNFVNLVDVGSPVDIAATYEEQGADELVLRLRWIDVRQCAMWLQIFQNMCSCPSP